MTRQIVVSITPDEDGVRCGECFGMQPEYPCDPQPSPLPDADGSDTFRGPECLAAERKLAALIEAGEECKDYAKSEGETGSYVPSCVTAWDRSVAEVKK